MAFMLKLEKIFQYKLMEGSDLWGEGMFWERAVLEIEGSLTT